MKLQIPQHELAHGLNAVARAVTGRSLLPVLSNVLLRCQNGHLILAATDLEIAVETQVNARIEEPGALTVPFRTLMDLVKALPDEPVELLADVDLDFNPTNTLKLESGKMKANIKGISVEEFPQLPVLDDNWPRIDLPAADFRRAVTGVAFAAASDSTRPTLAGVNVYANGGRVEMAATDGFRLSRFSFEADVDFGSADRSLIIPARALLEAVRLLPEKASPTEKADTVSIVLPEGREQAIFLVGSSVLTSQLINGNYPDYKAVIPEEWHTQAVVETDRLLHAVKLANVFAREANHTVSLRIDDQITIAALSAETGSNVGLLDAVVAGGLLELNVNAAYLMDALGAAQTYKVALQGHGPNEPLVLVVEDSDWLHLIMPMQTGR